MEMILFIGIQGAGKSTFYKEQFFHSHIRINLDMLRTRYREKKLIQTCLIAKQSLVVDNTNPTIEDRQKYIDWAKENQFQVTGYYFCPQFKDSLERNSNRPLEQRVPEIAIKSTIKKLEPPQYTEGFDKLFAVSIEEGAFVVKDI